MTRKFQRGRRIRSIDALIKQKFVWFQMPDGCHKIYHEGWVGSWQLHWVSGHLHRMYTVKVAENARLKAENDKMREALLIIAGGKEARGNYEEVAWHMAQLAEEALAAKGGAK
jgi:hypothetical protein